jgi:hypothetical protein
MGIMIIGSMILLLGVLMGCKSNFEEDVGKRKSRVGYVWGIILIYWYYALYIYNIVIIFDVKL